MKHLASLATLAIALASASSASAAGFYGGLGIHAYDPASSTGDIDGASSSLDTATALTGLVGYRFGRNDAFAVELNGALGDAEHTLSLGDGLGDLARIDQRPLSINALYRFGEGEFRPFVGVGYHRVDISATTVPAYDYLLLELEEPSGYTVTGGVDWQVTERVFVRADVRYIDWESDVHVAGAGGPQPTGMAGALPGGVLVGTAEVDPIVYGLSVGLVF
jgi:outer membrane protein